MDNISRLYRPSGKDLHSYGDTVIKQHTKRWNKKAELPTFSGR